MASSWSWVTNTVVIFVGMLDLADFFPGLQAESGVQVGKGLVKEQYPGHFYKGTGNGNALLLAAGKLGGASVHQLGDLHQLGSVLDAGVSFHPWKACPFPLGSARGKRMFCFTVRWG